MAIHDERENERFTKDKQKYGGKFDKIFLDIVLEETKGGIEYFKRMMKPETVKPLNGPELIKLPHTISIDF